MSKVKSQLTEAQWKELIGNFPTSGLSYREFAEKNDVKVHQIYYWKDKLAKKRKKEAQVNTNSFIKVSLPSEKPITPMPDPLWVAKFIKELYASN